MRQIQHFWIFWSIILLLYHLFKIRQGALGKKAFCQIWNRWFISWITGQNVQKLQILVFFTSCIAGILKYTAKHTGICKTYSIHATDFASDFKWEFHTLDYWGMLTEEHENFTNSGQRRFTCIKGLQIFSAFQQWFRIENQTFIKEMRPLSMLI